MSINKKNRPKHKKEHTTFDPKKHYRAKGSSGYGMKKDYVLSPEETSGKQLDHILNPK